MAIGCMSINRFQKPKWSWTIVAPNPVNMRIKPMFERLYESETLFANITVEIMRKTVIAAVRKSLAAARTTTGNMVSSRHSMITITMQKMMQTLGIMRDNLQS